MLFGIRYGSIEPAKWNEYSMLRYAQKLLRRWILIAAVALVLPSPAGAVDDRTLCDNADQSSTLDNRIAGCTRMIASGRYQRHALAIVYYNRGNHWRAKREFAKAIADYDRAIGIDPKYADAYNNRGVTFGDLRKPDLALQDFDQALRLDPKQVNAYRGRAFLLKSKGDLAGAIEAYTQAIRIDPRNVPSYRGRAELLKSKGDLVAAIDDYSHAIRIDSNNVPSYLDRGEVLRLKGDFDKAIADFDKAIAINPQNQLAYWYRAFAWYTKGLGHREKGERENAVAAFDRAISDFDEAIRISPNYDSAYVNRGLVWSAKGNADRAVADYTAAIGINPRDPVAYNNRANIRRTKRDFNAAIEDLNEALRLNPGFLLALVNRGQTYEAMRDFDRARADYRGTLSNASKSNDDKRAQDIARNRLTLLTSGAAGVAAAKPGAGAARLALVIGNGAYPTAGLDNPPNDARAVAAALRDIGFEVIEGIDLDQAAMKSKLRDFLVKSSAARIALVFYAGHALEIDRKNYLVPVDAKPMTSKIDAAYNLIDVDELILNQLDDDETRANIVILDSCRNNPFKSRIEGVRALGGGLAEYTSAAAGLLIAFATKGGQTAEDGTGAHSPFTEALLKHIRTPNLEINEMLLLVRQDVYKATGAKQWPALKNSLLGLFYLVDQRAQATAK
jgi:tetratricopeptide (TPR) repeat protein